MSDGNPCNAVATIVDGVVGVYERAIELDARSTDGAVDAVLAAPSPDAAQGVGRRCRDSSLRSE